MSLTLGLSDRSFEDTTMDGTWCWCFSHYFDILMMIMTLMINWSSIISNVDGTLTCIKGEWCLSHSLHQSLLLALCNSGWRVGFMAPCHTPPTMSLTLDHILRGKCFLVFPLMSSGCSASDSVWLSFPDWQIALPFAKITANCCLL